LVEKKRQLGKQELRLNKPKQIIDCKKCGVHFPGEGFFTCDCGIVNQCKRLEDGFIMVIPLVIKEVLNI